MKFQEYINNKDKINENFEDSQRIYEAGDEATEVDFGLFSVGGGGEIDAAAAVVGVAALVLAKGVYNYGVYKWLQGKLPNYIDQYKVSEAKSSSDLFDAIWERDKINPLKEKKMMLLGTGGERSDNDVEDPEAERGVKQQIKDAARAKLAQKNVPEEQKEQIRQQRDAALANIDKQIQAISDEIKRLEDEKTVVFSQKQEEFRKMGEKFEEQQDKFIEVRDSMFASAWKKRWDVEFKNAKGQADIEVLEKSLQMARDAGNKREIEAIQGKLKRSQEAQAIAKAAMDEVFSDTEKQELEQASLAELGIVEFIEAEEAYYDPGGQLETVYNKWVDLGKPYMSAKEGGRGKKAALETKIETAEKKIAKGKEMLAQVQDAGDDEKAGKIEKAIAKIEDDIKTYKEEIANLPESFSDDDFYRLSLHINEASEMLDGMFEEDGKKKKVKGNWTVVKDFMKKVISAAPDDKKEGLATEAVKDAKTLYNFENDIIKKQNVMVGLIDKRKKDNAEAKEKGYPEDVVPLPEGAAEMGKMKKLKPVEIEEKLKKYEDFVETMSKSFNADTSVEGEKPKDPEEASERDIEDLEVGDEEKDPAIIKQAKVLARAEANLKKFVNEFEPGEDEEGDQETIEKVRALRAEIKKHRKKGETEDAEKKQGEIDDLMNSKASSALSSKFDKLQDAVDKEREKLQELKKKKSDEAGTKKTPKQTTQTDNEPTQTTPADSQPKESEEVKKLKGAIEDQLKLIEDTKKKANDPKSPLANPDVLKQALSQEENKLSDLEQKLEDAKGKSSSAKEAQHTKIAPKYMKFEEFLAMKNHK
jgi:hypothetical protein